MKLTNYKKLVVPTIMAALLVSVPTTSNAYTKFTTNTTCLNSVATQQGKDRYTIPLKETTTSNKFYVVSRGGYYRPKYIPNKPVEIPSNNTEIPVEKPVENPTSNNNNNTNIPTTKPSEENNTGYGTTANGNHSLSADEIKMIELVNRERQAAGLKALQIDAQLSYVARIKSQDMSNNKYFSHDSPTYGSPFDMMTKFGIKYRGAAENIAKNQTVEAAHNSLMRSQGHKENIMNPNYTHIGIGIHNGHYTQMFISK